MSIETNLQIRDDASRVVANISRSVDSLNGRVGQFNNTPLTSNTSSALSAFSNVASTITKVTAGLFGAKIGFDMVRNAITTITRQSDEISSITARLNLMNDGLISTNDLWNSIYQSANRSRGSIIDISNSVAQLGLMTEGVFKNNQELIQFSENLTKSFKIAGTSAQGISSATLQLTQAMASGVLRGEELNSIFENAPLLIGNIADYMGVPIGQIRKLASEGKITADIVKNAILDATDEINAQFESMPMRFDELGTAFSNVWYNNMSMIQGSMSSIPQSIADNVLPLWDALTYSIFADLDGVEQKHQEVVENTIGIYGRFAEKIKAVTGIVFTENEAMKIDFLTTGEFIESILKKIGNGVLETFDFCLDAINWLLDSFLNGVALATDGVAKMIDSLTGGLTNLSNKTTAWANKTDAKKNTSYNEMIGYENRLNDKFFGVPINKLYDTITKQAIENVTSSRPKDINNITTSSISLPKTTSIPKTVNNIAKDVNNIAKGIDSLNGINKSIQEINEANYHNNVANQFSGNIQIVAYGVDEEGQKAIGKHTEDAIRRVFYGDYQETTAMGVYA